MSSKNNQGEQFSRRADREIANPCATFVFSNLFSCRKLYSLSPQVLSPNQTSISRIQFYKAILLVFLMYLYASDQRQGSQYYSINLGSVVINWGIIEVSKVANFWYLLTSGWRYVGDQHHPRSWASIWYQAAVYPENSQPRETRLIDLVTIRRDVFLLATPLVGVTRPPTTTTLITRETRLPILRSKLESYPSPGRLWLSIRISI